MFNANGNFDLLKNNYLFATIAEKVAEYFAGESRCGYYKAWYRRCNAAPA